MGRNILFLVGALFFSSSAFAMTFKLPAPGNDMVGKVRWTQSLPDDDFSTLGRRYDIGYFELVEANPTTNPKLPHPGTLVVVPTEFLLPNTPHVGIVVNLAELRVYYYRTNKDKVVTYPVGIGREGWDTPLGKTTIVAKVKNPTWVVPADIKADRAKDGVILPNSIGPGPDNPLGAYAFYLGFPGAYRMHGTNDPSGIGRRSSAGCIRMWPEDVEELFSHVKKGTPILVIDDPYKVGWENGKLYLESHVPLQEQIGKDGESLSPMVAEVRQAIAGKNATVDWKKADAVALAHSGIPEVIGQLN